jgi:hypothetical protein
MDLVSILINATRNDISETYGLNYNLICANSCVGFLDHSIFSAVNVNRMLLLKPQGGFYGKN